MHLNLKKVYYRYFNYCIFFSCSKQEAFELVQDILRCLNFTYENLTKCFSDEKNHFYLDHFFYMFFSRLLSNKKNINEIRQNDFNFLQPAAYTIYLPQDAQIQIDTALSEMEAMDYRDWVLKKIKKNNFLY